jgi:hypothetical protein
MEINDELSFEDLSAEEFEELCTAILSHEELGLIVERYGRSGQKQFGVDIVGLNATTGEVIAIECKRRAEISLGLMKSIIQRFWQNKDRWVKNGVRRFIICIPAEIRDRRINDFWLQEAKRFRQADIGLEIWSARTLNVKISRLPDIRRRFFRSYDLRLGWKARTTELQELPIIKPTTRQSQAKLNLLSNLRLSQFGTLIDAVRDETDEAERDMLEDHLVDASSAAGFLGSDPSSGIAVLRRLLDVPVFHRDWKFRRTLGRIAGEYIGVRRPNARLRRQIQAFAEHCLDKPNTSILLGVAATSSLYAPRTLGTDVLNRLMAQRHPQVRWLIMRGWSVIEPVIVDAFPLSRLLETDDRWLRRRFMLTLMRNLQSTNRTELRALLTEHVQLDSSVVGNKRFEGALGRWLALNVDIDLFKSKESHFDGTMNPDLSVLLRSLKLRGSNNDVYSFSAALDYYCISLDYYSSSPGTMHIGRIYSEGRYGIIRQWVEEGLSSIRRDLLPNFLINLLDCADEGIRWAITALLPRWLPNISAKNIRRELIIKVLTDWHPWIVREGLEQLSQEPSYLHGLDPLELLSICSASVDKAVHQGWAENEFSRGFLKLLSLYPDFVEQIKVRRVA